MAVRITLDLVVADYSMGAGGPARNIRVTPQQAALLATLIQLAEIREAWDDPNDPTWDVIQEQVADVNNQILRRV